MLGLPYTLYLLKRHIGTLHIREFFGQHLKLVIASFIAMFPLFIFANFWHGINETSPLYIRAVELLVIIVLGVIGYFLVGKWLKIAEIGILMEYFTRRSGYKDVTEIAQDKITKHKYEDQNE